MFKIKMQRSLKENKPHTAVQPSGYALWMTFRYHHNIHFYSISEKQKCTKNDRGIAIFDLLMLISCGRQVASVDLKLLISSRYTPMMTS